MAFTVQSNPPVTCTYMYVIGQYSALLNDVGQKFQFLFLPDDRCILPIHKCQHPCYVNALSPLKWMGGQHVFMHWHFQSECRQMDRQILSLWLFTTSTSATQYYLSKQSEKLHWINIVNTCEWTFMMNLNIIVFPLKTKLHKCLVMKTYVLFCNNKCSWLYSEVGT